MPEYEKLRQDVVDDPSSRASSETLLQENETYDKRIASRSAKALNAYLLGTNLAVLLAVLACLIWLLTHRMLILPEGSSIASPQTAASGPGPGIASCGTSSAAARAANCHFDIFSFSWTPPECTDMELYNMTLKVLDKQREGAPAFYHGLASTRQPVDIAAVQSHGQHPNEIEPLLKDGASILGTWEHYLVACGYAWQKVQRAAMRQWPIDGWSSSYALAAKCGPDMLWRGKQESTSIAQDFKERFPVCGMSLDDLKVQLDRDLRELGL